MKLVERGVATTVRVWLELTSGGPATGLVDADFTSKQFCKGIADEPFDALSGTIEAIAFGWYQVPFSALETDEYGELLLHLEVPGVVTLDAKVAQIVGFDPESLIATSSEIAAIQSDTNDIQTRLPAALVGGRMDSSVGGMAANVVTASALAADAVTEIADALPDEVDIAAAVWDGLLTDHFDAGSFGEAVRLILGLTQQNYMLDNTVFTGTDLTGARIRLFPSAAAVAAAVDGAANGADGEIAGYSITVVYEATGKVATYKVAKL